MSHGVRLILPSRFVLESNLLRGHFIGNKDSNVKSVFHSTYTSTRISGLESTAVQQYSVPLGSLLSLLERRKKKEIVRLVDSKSSERSFGGK